ncbi:hypothetical protein ACWGID_10705 [Kribbella sp. NPDC054772]
MGEPYPRTQCDRRTERGNAVLAVLGGMAVGVILVLLAWLVVLVTKDPPASHAADTPASAPAARAKSAPAAPVPTRTVTVTPSAKGTSTPTSGDVRELPAGMFCRDLKAQGLGYAAAVDYWYLHGQPKQMDADRNGIPCETVYSRSSVAAYWNGREVNGVVNWQAGMYCRDLVARGASYAEAVRYWWYYGMPARMDADKNGIPCETVYSSAAVNAFWYP